jgi:purine catabolism regulator
VLAQLSNKNASEDLRSTISALVRYLKKEAKIKGGHHIKIGVGRPSNSITKIKQSYQEAREALKVCLLSKKSIVIYFEDLGFFKILSEKSKKDLSGFVNELLHPVLEYDRKKNGELINTLQTYFETNRNLKLTSKKMFTHYNTILYRIKKIEKMTGTSLDSPRDSLNMEIAVNIYELMKSGRNRS